MYTHLDVEVGGGVEAAVEAILSGGEMILLVSGGVLAAGTLVVAAYLFFLEPVVKLSMHYTGIRPL